MGDEEGGKVDGQVREYRAATDASEVTQILRVSEGAASWPEPELRELNRLAGVSAYVSQGAEGVLGFAVGRRMVDDGEILNLAVKPVARRRGEARRLVERLLREFQEKGVSRVFLEVRESNSGAIRFYERFGFRAAGIRKDYYQAPQEAAVIMEVFLKESTGQYETLS